MSAEPWIDNLARTLATGQSRRAALKQLVGGIAGALLASTLPGRAASAAKCQPKGGSCAGDSDCCSGLTCQSGVCGPSKCRSNGTSCTNNVQCCSGTCCNGVCCTNCVPCAGGGVFCCDGAQCCETCFSARQGPCSSEPQFQCCSGLICQNSTCCGPQGTSCVLPSDCCSGTCSTTFTCQ